MRSALRPAITMLLLFTLLTGVLYPVAVTGIGRAFFAPRAEGSLIFRGGRAVGSRLIGQPFDDPKYFWGRLSATGPVPYNAASSSGSNYGPLNPALLDAARARIAALRGADPETRGAVPVDLVTASGSGLDPDISIAAAAFQVSRVAKARGLDENIVRRLVAAHTTGRFLRVIGEPVVHVLELNLALDGRGDGGSR